MRSVISQSLVLPASAQALFGMYMDPVLHAAITAAPVTISAKPGSPFHAFEGALTGTMLQVVAPHLIVQSWRSTHFNQDDPDSTLVLSFTPEGGNGRIDLIHLDVPAQDYQGVNDGWETFYWTPWRRYLAS
jgi:uncharacterized protein YndB with AHSA1/START domain